MAYGKDLKSSNVFTAIKSIKKHEAELHTQSKVPPIVAVMPPSNDVLDSRLFTNAGVNYVNDTLQVISNADERMQALVLSCLAK